jgi:hypothetical protein
VPTIELKLPDLELCEAQVALLQEQGLPELRTVEDILTLIPRAVIDSNGNYNVFSITHDGEKWRAGFIGFENLYSSLPCARGVTLIDALYGILLQLNHRGLIERGQIRNE